MKQATLDLLDVELRKESSRFKNYPFNVRFKLYRKEFLLDPANWEKYYPQVNKYTYDWKELKFSELQNLDDIIDSEEPGIYFFCVKPPIMVYDLPIFVLYVGISNERDSNRPLKDRLKDYFYLNEIKKRKNVHIMLQMFYEHIYVVYSLLNLESSELRELEKALHGFYYPVQDRRDFPSEFKEAQKAWGAI